MLEKTSYSKTVDQLDLLLKEGPLGVKCDNYSFVKRPWTEKISLMATLYFSRLTPEQAGELKRIYSLATIKVQILNSAHQELKTDSSYFSDYLAAAKTIQLWNSYQGGWQERLLKKAGIETLLPPVEPSVLPF